MMTAGKKHPYFIEALQSRINQLLDRVQPVGFFLHHRISIFHLCGYIGLTLALLLAMTLVSHVGLSRWVMAGVVLIAICTFFGLAMVTKIIKGEEYLVYYYHEIAVLSMTALFLWLLGQPILAYLDITLLGVGAFLMCGRVGCLMVGCCHGRPHQWGVCYRQEHAKVGFADYLVGVRLFPIQAVESLFVGFVVLVGTLLVVSGQPPGTALAWYIVTYDLGRFAFEFMRGDAERPYWGGFSEAQWISLILTLGVTMAEWTGILPFQAWHSAAAAGLVMTMIGVTFYRRRQKPAVHQLLYPHHIREVALALRRNEVKPIRDEVMVQETSLGIRISSGTIHHPAGEIQQFTFSFPSDTTNNKAAYILAQLVMQLRQLTGGSELITGQQHVFHLLVHPSAKGSKG